MCLMAPMRLLQRMKLPKQQTYEHIVPMKLYAVRGILSVYNSTVKVPSVVLIVAILFGIVEDDFFLQEDQ